MSVLVITGTGTEVGKTVTTAAVAALAAAEGRRVAVLKPAQTGLQAGEHGDADEVARLAGKVTTRELRRYPDPLAPLTAARRAGLPQVRPQDAAAAAAELATGHDVVLVEGAGGLLVRMDDTGGTLADVAWSLGSPALLVVRAGLGTLNEAALSAEVLLHRGVDCVGVVVGSWPAEPGLAERCNLTDLPDVTGAPLLGVLPAGAARLPAEEFLQVARDGLSPWFGGVFDPDVFAATHACHAT